MTFWPELKREVETTWTMLDAFSIGLAVAAAWSLSNISRSLDRIAKALESKR